MCILATPTDQVFLCGVDSGLVCILVTPTNRVVNKLATFFVLISFSILKLLHEYLHICSCVIMNYCTCPFAVDVEHSHVRFLGNLVLNLWDCGGSVRLVQNSDT